jgi:hypothetical protein
MLNEFVTIVRTASLVLPALEVSLLLAILTFCVLCQFTRVGLFAAHVFLYRRGWRLFVDGT